MMNYANYLSGDTDVLSVCSWVERRSTSVAVECGESTDVAGVAYQRLGALHQNLGADELVQQRKGPLVFFVLIT